MRDWSQTHLQTLIDAVWNAFGILKDKNWETTFNANLLIVELTRRVGETNPARYYTVKDARLYERGYIATTSAAQILPQVDAWHKQQLSRNNGATGVILKEGQASYVPALGDTVRINPIKCPVLPLRHIVPVECDVLPTYRGRCGGEEKKAEKGKA